MQSIDWVVVGVYLAGMLGMAWWLGRRQRSREDYFLGGKQLGPWSLATSTMATQCSTNSLLGAPAFVGFVAGGGMLWLQYELAVPLAMLLLIPLLGSIRQSGAISVYGYLEQRLGRGARRIASGTFLLFRGVATGVTVYGVGIVLTLLLDVSFTQAVLLLMGITIAYDLMGGMRAVVVSDVIQLVLIVVTVAVSLALLLVGLDAGLFVEPERVAAVQFSLGLDKGSSYGFWPMLCGGLFLYMAYYGCDQSQAQRVLSSRTPAEAERVLVLNGVLRFPVVLLYCLLGLALGAYALQEPQFIEQLPLTAAQAPNYNLVFPVYVLQTFPPGLVGLVMVGIFAAAMSSIDSALNALAASTVEDYLQPWLPDERSAFVVAKVATLAWGLFAVVFSFQVEAIAPTVLEAINKVGSMANGPLLALFVLALLFPAVGQRAALCGFFAGIATNALLWTQAPALSWLWWNLIGFVVACGSALLLRMLRVTSPTAATGQATNREAYRPGTTSAPILLGMAMLILTVCLGLGIRAA